MYSSLHYFIASIPEKVYRFDLVMYHDLLAMIFAVEEINQDHFLLGNKTLGFKVYDACYTEARAIESIFTFLSGLKQLIPNYICKANPIVAGIIGDWASSSSLPIARILGIYRFPQISHGAGLPVLSDKLQFPSFLRTVPSAYYQPFGLAQFIVHYGWTWVGLVATDNDFGIQGSQQLKEELIKVRVCLAYYEVIPTQIPKSRAVSLVHTIKKSSATVVVIYAFTAQVISLMEEILQHNITGKVWIASSSWAFSDAFSKKELWKALHGTLAFTFYSGNIPGFKEFLYTLSPSRYPNDNFIKELWETAFGCKWPVNGSAEILSTENKNAKSSFCTGKESLESLDAAVYQTEKFRCTYTMHNAVYTLAFALHNLQSCSHGEGPFANKSCTNKNNFQLWQLLHYVRKVHFQNKSGQKVFYDENGDVPPLFDFINWQLTAENSMSFFKVGSYKPSSSQHPELSMNDSAIVWSGGHKKIPKSFCSDSCSAGFRKVPLQGEPVCCFGCAPCPEGEISNFSETGDCVKCPENYWSNSQKDVCIPKYMEFLSYEEPLGASLATISTVLSLVPLAALCIFVRHHDTPVVKANNREVSYFLLLSMVLCFLCALLFIGRPRNENCIFRQTAFGVFFTLCVSSVLAKTITVVIAFKATKPGSKLQKWMASRTSFLIIIFCSLLQVVVCVAWLIISPPFVDINRSFSWKLIVECNEGSLAMFYCMLGYFGFLAIISFVAAFLARNLPDSFNEARYITFSMIVFVSVWLSFVPAYLSTKGKYMVAVEIFAIISSNAGLFICIFSPKCYIILLRPEKNSREYLRDQKYVEKKSGHLSGMVAFASHHYGYISVIVGLLSKSISNSILLPSYMAWDPLVIAFFCL
ncbi:vomeronasal type-2 receptor 1-like [Protopterus annectens]|uniref:vomeronasal type-2 receptor 1-like n=1 Tax=Protopterus annectens TaxID=7888 RepID=UPI001CFB01ED|nr:vomeronasal type-2 receptor 1-like [Protopterus annectens]